MTSGTSTPSLGAAASAAPLQPFASPSAVTAPPGGTQADGASSRAGATRWRSLRGRTTALTVLFAAAAAASAFGVASAIHQLLVLGDMDGTFVGFDRIQRAHDAEDLVAAAAISCALISIVIAVPFIAWMWRAAKNNEALGRDHPRLGPGWAIGGWFVPLANLVVPVLVMQDLWRGSAEQIPRGDMRWRITDRSVLVGWWWAALVVSIPRLTRIGAGTTAASQLNDLRTSAAVGLVCMLSGVVAAVLAMLVVRRLAARQAACLLMQQAAWATA